MIIYMLISIVAIRLAPEGETGIIWVMDRICSEVMRRRLGCGGNREDNLLNISECSVMNRGEGIEVGKVSGHLILGRSIGDAIDIGTVGKEASLPFVPLTATSSI